MSKLLEMMPGALAPCLPGENGRIEPSCHVNLNWSITMATASRTLLLGCLRAALICGVLAAAAIPAAAQEWAPFGMSQNGDAITLDRRSILKQGGNAAFTMRVDFNTPADVDGKSAQSLTARIEIDCGKQTYRRAEETFWDAAGTALSTTAGPGWVPIPDSSFGAALRNFCQ